MARRSSLLSSVVPLPAQAEVPEPDAAPPATPEPAVAQDIPTRPAAAKVREATIHIGGYFPVNDKLVVEFQKLKFDLRKSQQQMLHEALSDYVHKHRAKAAFE
jgi:hypothetical protein